MKRSIALGAAAACLCSTLTAQEAVELLHYETLQSVGAGTHGAAKPGIGYGSRLSFDAFGKRFDVLLEPNARLANAARSLDLPIDVVAYRGTLASSEAGWARIVETPRGPSGLIWDGTTLYGVEQRGDSLVTADRTVIFRLDDVYVVPGALGCSVAAAPISGGQAFASLIEEMTTLAASGANLNLDIGAVADFEFHEAFGADTEQALLTRLNNIDGIFSQQLGIQVTVAEVDVFTSDGDPFTESDAEALLEELAVYRGATPEQDAQGLTHLFTGRDLDGSTVGIAYLGVVCSTRSSFDPLGRSFGSGLSEGRRGSVLDSLIAAHEMGHNFGAPHDSEAGSECEATPAAFLMAPSINGVDQFSTCSIEQMQPEIAAASCLTPIGAPDISVTVTDEDIVVGTGIALDYFVDVANLGVEAATGVVLDIAVESGLDVLSAEVDAGACTTGGQAVSCPLDDVPGGASRRLRLTLRGPAPGEFALTATVAALEDADSDNDTAGGVVTIVPVVDLVLSGIATELEVGRSSTLEATLTNESDFPASTVALTASLSSGLRIESATLAGEVCTIAAQSIDCTAPSLAARAQVALSVVVTGLATGAEQATLSATADEDERNAANNSLVLAIQIVLAPTPAATPEEEAGGGATSPLWLAIGALGLLGRRRTAMRRSRSEPGRERGRARRIRT